MVAGALMHGVYLGGVFWAISRGLPAGLAALIGGLQPLITSLLAASLLGEKISPSQWAGLAAGFAGVVIVLEPKLGTEGGGVTAATLTAVLVAVTGISAGTIWQKRFAGKGGLLAGACWQYAGGALVMALLSAAFESRRFTLTGELVLALSIGAIFLLMLMIRDGAMARVASFFYLVPAVTAIIAWPVFGETLSLVQIGGMALATFGVALATRR
jgi:drug/metabolite transporter (DMT)-like permease